MEDLDSAPAMDVTDDTADSHSTPVNPTENNTEYETVELKNRQHLKPSRAKLTDEERRQKRLENLEKARAARQIKQEQSKAQLNRVITERADAEEEEDDEEPNFHTEYDAPPPYRNSRPPKLTRGRSVAPAADEEEEMDIPITKAELNEFMSYIAERLHNMEFKQTKSLNNKRAYQARTQPKIERHQHIEIKHISEAPPKPAANPTTVKVTPPTPKPEPKVEAPKLSGLVKRILDL